MNWRDFVTAMAVAVFLSLSIGFPLRAVMERAAYDAANFPSCYAEGC